VIIRALHFFIILTSFNGLIFSQWFTLSSGTSSNLKSVFFHNSLTGYVSGSSGMMLKTSNGGVNWNTLQTGITDDINSVYFVNFTTGYASANTGKIIYTSNGGNNWVSVSTGITDNLYSVHSAFCTGSGGSLLYTTNGGLNWVVAVNGSISSYYGIQAVSPTTAFACGVNTIFQPLIAKTTNGGANWSYSVFYLNGNEGNLRDIHFLNNNEGFAVSNVWNGQGGISYTSNAGLNWTTQLYTRALNSIDIEGVAGYSAGIQGYIIKSTNAGQSWFEQQSGVTSILRSVDAIDSLIAYAVGDGGVIIKTTNGGITAIEPVSTEIPNQYSLFQNYPNPFNPTTKIKFAIPVGKGRDRSMIKIYDALGREISTLVNEELNPGTYEVDWNASNYPSGIYYYKIISGSFSETKKMLLIK
jgi:photosystem II stability/assembly factor-like uncharacterized protein